MSNIIMFAFAINIKTDSLHPSFLSRHGCCALKLWEIDLRDICHRLRCFFACCKGQIIVHTSEVDGSEPESEIQDDKKDL